MDPEERLTLAAMFSVIGGVLLTGTGFITGQLPLLVVGVLLMALAVGYSASRP